MNFAYYNQFDSFSEFNCDGFPLKMGSFRSLEGRLHCFKVLIQKIISLPFAVFFKTIITSFRLVGLLMSMVLVTGTFGASVRAREFFFRRVLFFSRDFAEWVVFPFIVVLSFLRLILGSTLHPAAYFR